MENKQVAVIILNWNGEKLLREFLPSVVRNTNPELGRVIVADNDSTDGSLKVLKEEFPEVEVLTFDRNYGFAGGYNRALAQVEAEYVVLLNSDVEVVPGWLEPLVRVLDEDSGVAAIQPKIKAYREKDKFEYAGACGGFLDRWGFPFCRGRILDVTEPDTGQYDQVADVFWCSGAALFIRRELYQKCGGLDEQFFAHMEEIDLCWRLRNQGYRLQVNPEAVVYHLGGGSLPMNHPRKLFLNYRNNLLMLHKNLSVKERRKTLRVRFWFDSAAFFLFLLKGQFSNAKAVTAAYRSYREMKNAYPYVTAEREDDCIYNGSIVIAFFVRGVRAFSALHWR